MARAGLSNFIGNAPFHLVEDKYRGAGYEMIFGDDSRLGRLVKGDYQIVAVSMNSVLLNLGMILGNAKVVYAYVKAAGDGSDLIICRGEVNDAEQLAELRIGVQKASLEHFIFEYLFFLNGVKRRREYFWMNRGEYHRAMKAEQIDAAVFCDPALSQILSDDKFRLFGGDMKKVVLTAMGVIAIRQDTLTDDKGRIEEFVSILSEGIKAVDSADDSMLKAKGGAFLAGINSPKKKLLSEVAFLSLEENRKLFAPEEDDSLFKRCSEWLEFLKSSGFETTVGSGLSAASIFDPGIVKAL
jgi:hypothetical protein